jgi:hypothetical protein
MKFNRGVNCWADFILVCTGPIQFLIYLKFKSNCTDFPTMANVTKDWCMLKQYKSHKVLQLIFQTFSDMMTTQCSAWQYNLQHYVV